MQKVRIKKRVIPLLWKFCDGIIQKGNLALFIIDASKLREIGSQKAFYK
jgi:hypothetical protein